MRYLTFLFVVLALLLATTTSTLAQGILIVENATVSVRLPRPPIIIPPPHHHPPIVRPPRPTPPPQSYKIKELAVQAKLVGQIATVQVAQTFTNTGSRQMEVSFVFPLPYDGAIDRLTLLVDGKEYEAKLLDKDKARSMYEAIVRKNKDPALLEWMGTGLFKTSVFPVPAGASRTVEIRYTQLLKKASGLTDFIFPLSTAKYTSAPVEKVSFRIAVNSDDAIKNVYSPSHPIEIKRPDGKTAIATYEKKNVVPSTDFRLFFDEGKDAVTTKILTYKPKDDEDGYFLLLATPKVKVDESKRVKKNLQIVIDRSGSMSGEKIKQAREAVKFVINKLHKGDTFNIVAYDSQVEAFRSELQRFDDTTRKEALAFTESIFSGGSTNIDGALRVSLDAMKSDERPNYLLFLTDGRPTTGERNEMKIAAKAKDYNKVRARMFVFGVGYDVNSRLLDRLANDSRGTVEYVRPDDDIEASVAKLYNRIKSPVLTDVQLKFDFDGSNDKYRISRLYPSDAVDLFAGEQLVLVGRYKQGGKAKVLMRGSLEGKKQDMTFGANFVKNSKDESFAFVERLWAIRRIGEIIDEVDLNGKNDELIKELVELSTRHGVLTPYTSFMADENSDFRDVATNTATTRRRLEMLSATTGRSAGGQRAMKQMYKSAGQGGANFSEVAEKAKGDAFSAPAEPPMIAADMAAPRAMPSGHAGAPGAGAGGFGAPAYRAPAKKEGRANTLADEKALAKQNVRQIGNRTFYQQRGQWVDSQVKKEQEAKAIEVEQFKPEYFALVKKYGKKLTPYLIFDEPVLINLEGQAYLVVPPKS